MPVTALFLRQLSYPSLIREAQHGIFPKWSTLCLLKALDLPTLDAVAIPPFTSPSVIRNAANKFRNERSLNRLLVRSDGGPEVVQYYRGGNSFSLKGAVSKSVDLAKEGRMVILTEPTDRFSNLLTVSVLLRIDGTFSIDILGPGYDASDLNRGGIVPPLSVIGSNIAWPEHSRITVCDYRIVRDGRSEERRRQRLYNLGTYVLPDIGEHVDPPREAFAEQWLKDRGYFHLWRKWAYTPDLARIRAWYDDAFYAISYLRKLYGESSFVMYGSVLPTGRFIYWDIVDASRKWASPAEYRADRI